MNARTAPAKSYHGAIDDDVANTDYCYRRSRIQVAGSISNSTHEVSDEFVSMLAAGAASTLIQGTSAAVQPARPARNVVLVHGLFAGHRGRR
jgi:hypothetical protein